MDSLLSVIPRLFYSRTARSSTPRRIKKNKFRLKELMYRPKEDTIPKAKIAPFEGKTNWTMGIETKAIIHKFLIGKEATKSPSAIPSFTTENLESKLDPFILDRPYPDSSALVSKAQTEFNVENSIDKKNTKELHSQEYKISRELTSTCPWIKMMKEATMGEGKNPISIINEMAKNGKTPVTYTHICYAVVESCRIRDVAGAILLYKKCGQLGLRQTVWLYSMVMQVHINASRIPEALQMYCYLRSNDITPTSTVLNDLLAALIRSGAEKSTWEIFYELKSKYILPMRVYSLMLELCAKNLEAERALKIVRDMEAKAIVPTSQVVESLLHACSNRVDKKDDVLSIIKKIFDDGHKPHLTLYNYMLQAYSTNCDLEEFSKIWNVLISPESGPGTKPDKFSYSAMFRLLANLPHSQKHACIKHVNFHYNLKPESIIEEAKLLWNGLLSNKYRNIKIETFLINDYLSILANLGDKDMVESFFVFKYRALKIPHNETSYEHMFHFYYRTMDFKAAIALKQKISSKKITLEAWDSLIQLASNARELDAAIGFIEEVVSLSMEPPKLTRIKKLYISIANAERWDLRDKLNNLCKRREDYDLFKGGKREIWSTRNDAINTLLDFAYGRPGGECNVRGVYGNLKPHITILPSDKDSKSVSATSIPGFSKIISQSVHKPAPSPTRKRQTMNHQLRKKKAI